MKQLLLTAFALTALVAMAIAQTDSSQKTNPHLTIGISYNSNLNYYGRTDSLQSSGIIPMAELWFTPSFYISAAPVWVHNQMTTCDYAGTVATLGYQHSTDHWFTQAYVMKPFYKATSQLVQAALKVQSGLSISYLSAIINLTAGGDVKGSDKVDYGATASLDHIFRIEAGQASVVIIDPSVTAYAGTQQYTNTYYKRKGGSLLRPGRTQQVTQHVNQFVLLAYEASLPLIYTHGPVQLQATPSYIVPQNLLSVKNRPDLSEQGRKTFYTTLSVKYTF